MRAKYAFVGLAVLLAAVAAGGFLYWRTRPSTTPPKQQQAEPAPLADVNLPATVRARHVVPVPAPVDGTLDALLVEVGQPVYEGQVVARIKNTAIEAERETAARDLAQVDERLNRAESDLSERRLEHSRARAEQARVQNEFDRIEKLFLRQQTLLREGATPKREFDKAEAAFKEASTEREVILQAAAAAQERLDAVQKRYDALRVERDEKDRELDAVNLHAAAAEVRAPVEGLLVGVARQVGEQVTADIADLLSIATNLAELEAVVEPPPPALARIKPGQEALLAFPELPEPAYGKVRDISGTQVIIEFAASNPAIQPGMNGQARIKFR